MTPPTPFNTARARIVANEYPGLPSELLLAAVERLEELGDVSAPAGIIGDLAKRLPPTPTAPMLEHIAYALAVAPTLTQAVRALDTVGVSLSHGWPIDTVHTVDGYGQFRAQHITLDVSYFVRCARLHRSLVIGSRETSTILKVDLDIEHREGGAA